MARGQGTEKRRSRCSDGRVALMSCDVPDDVLLYTRIFFFSLIFSEYIYR